MVASGNPWEGGGTPERDTGTPERALGPQRRVRDPMGGCRDSMGRARTPWKGVSQGPHRWFWGPHGRMLGLRGMFRDPMQGWGQKGTPQLRVQWPHGGRGGSSRPPGLGAMAEQDRELEPGWLLSPAGRPYLDSILHKNQRRAFGIEATTLFWPAKPRASGRPVLFQLHLWDCGDGALRKFEHLLPACKEEADAALFLFSFTDRASFEELPALMGRVLGPGDRGLVRVVVGTKFDLAPHAAVTEGDVRAFEGTWGLRVLRAGGAPGAGGARAGLARVAPVLDALVEGLWRRDQVTAGITPGDKGDPPI
ncbi:ciliogenesis and planar polarity effector 2 isoform X2 [Corvus cornix cornix]|uniref:ciliogenesis and planar polarity effector 2 isoform X2 n=1 Tax=Corvus cornix cornix TaxID=932674 RepID=UPI001951572B|nr:ciliogenesis and planar polarity effector 2 isoform X2 [Corvus cornix cornix]